MERVNLIPDRDREARAVRKRLGRWSAALLCAVPVLVAAFSLKCYQEALATEAATEKERLAITVETSRAALADLRIAVARTGARRSLAEQMKYKRRWSRLITEVVDAMPPGVWLTSVSSDPAVPGLSRGSTPGGASSGAEKRPGTFEVTAARELILKGESADASSPLQFVDSLKRTGAFAATSHDHVRRSGGENANTFQFEIRCRW